MLQEAGTASGTGFSQIFFKDLDHNYYNNSLKYVADITILSKTPVTANINSEVFLKDFFSKFEDMSEQQLRIHSHFLKKFLNETLHFSWC